MKIVTSLWRLSLCLFMVSEMAHAEPIDVGQVLGFTPGIRGAVELVFQSEVGKYYQIQISADMATWDNEGYSVKGTGGQVSVLARTRSLASAYYRLRDDGSADNVAPVGPAGPEGPAGPVGPTGPAGPAGSDASVTAANTLTALLAMDATQERSLQDALDFQSRSDLGTLRGLRNLIQLPDGNLQTDVIMIGDSFNLGLYNGLEKLTLPRGSYRCGQVAGGGDAGVTFATGDYSKSPDGKYWTITSGGNLTCGYLQTGSAGPADTVHYTFFPGTGIAQIQYRHGATSDWTNVGSAIDTSTIANVRIGDFTLPGYRPDYKLRVTATGGMVNGWLGMSHQGPGLRSINFATTGQDIGQTASIPQAIWQAMIAGYSVDLVMSTFADHRFTSIAGAYPKGTESWADGGPMDNLRTWSLQANSSVDWLVVGAHPVDPSLFDPADDIIDPLFAALGIDGNTDVRVKDGAKAARDWALLKGEGFFDSYSLFPSYAEANADGLYADQIHLSEKGKQFNAAALIAQTNLGRYFGSTAVRVGDMLLSATRTHQGAPALAVYNYNNGALPSMGIMTASQFRACFDNDESQGIGFRCTGGSVGQFYNWSSGNESVTQQLYGTTFRPGTTTLPGSAAQAMLGDFSRRYGDTTTAGLKVGVQTKAGAFSLSATDHTIVCTGAGGWTITVPASFSGNDLAPAGRQYVILNKTSGNITLAASSDGSNLQKINNATTLVVTAGGTARIISTGTLTSGDYANWVTW